MSDVLTYSEIESLFPSHWVLVQDPTINDSLEVQSGSVAYHSRDRDDVYRKAMELRPNRFAMLYMGSIPKDTDVVL